jgi:hypothetical protein
MKQPETQKMLIVSFFINSDKTEQDLRPILQLVIYLIGKNIHKLYLNSSLNYYKFFR